MSTSGHRDSGAHSACHRESGSEKYLGFMWPEQLFSLATLKLARCPGQMPLFGWLLLNLPMEISWLLQQILINLGAKNNANSLTLRSVSQNPNMVLTDWNQGVRRAELHLYVLVSPLHQPLEDAHIPSLVVSRFFTAWNNGSTASHITFWILLQISLFTSKYLSCQKGKDRAGEMVQ